MWLLQMPSLLNSEERDELERRLAGTSPERMMREMLDALQVISRDSPIVIYLEDLHFSDIASVQVTERLCQPPRAVTVNDRCLLQASAASSQKSPA